MQEVNRWAMDLTYGSVGAVYISIMMFFERMFADIVSAKHDDIDFWWSKGTAAVVFMLLVIYHVKRILQLNKKHKHEVATQSYFDGYIVAGNELRGVKQYDLALSKFQKALDLNFDNDTATAKINEVKYLIDASHK